MKRIPRRQAARQEYDIQIADASSYHSDDALCRHEIGLFFKLAIRDFRTSGGAVFLISIPIRFPCAAHSTTHQFTRRKVFYVN